VIAASLAWGSAAVAQPRVDAALQNYEQVLRGANRPDELTLQERADLAELERRLRRQKLDKRTSGQRCVDAALRSRGTLTGLARRTVAARCGISLDDVLPGERQ
jgi:hypothetical protein